MNCCSNTITSIVIPLLSALLGGGMTLAGVLITIIHGNNKSKKEYLEKIRPYLVVESVQDIVKKEKEFISVFMADDCKEESENKTVYHWNSLLLTNMSESVCIVNYVMINSERYDVYEKKPLKTGEICEIRGFPFSCYLRESQIDKISIGILDKQFNQYEYAISFEIKDCEKKRIEAVGNPEKEIIFNILDCSKNLCKKDSNKKNAGGKKYEHNRKTI
ncbi:MAG: hypothetical protein E7517_07430 [Ruminococcaceae bacterium]|nr:hypothetical protein [Oscillospiraceae bacterium]